MVGNSGDAMQVDNVMVGNALMQDFMQVGNDKRGSILADSYDEMDSGKLSCKRKIQHRYSLFTYQK